MDWFSVLFLGVLVACVVLICITLVTLPQLGDERKNLIKMKAQSFSFAVVIIWMLFEIGESVYLTLWTESSYQGISPISFSVAISAAYLISLLFFKKKYGG